MTDMHVAILALESVIAIQSMTFQKQAVGADFDFTVVTVDPPGPPVARTWSQVVDVTPFADPYKMTFSISGQWSLPETNAIKAVCDVAVALAQTSAMTMVKFERVP